MHREINHTLNVISTRLLTWADWQGGVQDTTTPQEAQRLRLAGAPAHCSATLPQDVVRVLGVPVAQALGYLMVDVAGEALINRTSWRTEIKRWGRIVGLTGAQRAVLLCLCEYYAALPCGAMWSAANDTSIEGMLQRVLDGARK